MIDRNIVNKNKYIYMYKHDDYEIFWTAVLFVFSCIGLIFAVVLWNEVLWNEATG